ncbi:7239_t:CDS:2 [Funneliformis mosseae]|uniref:RNA-dependent RNA polymerase n=1 Tax=Funneliformis mosseae TaxID=27381 RepID=A0A9N9GLH1_FUNMO|nr:7239_t:CDS:2 [Funneliformis mosseae]
MNEIAKADPDLLDVTVRRFITHNKINETSKNIIQLRELFTEELIRVSVNIPGYSDEDEEWESSLNQADETFLPSPSSPSLSLSRASSTFEDPWITQNHSTTKMPEEFEHYVEGIPFLDRHEIIRILKPFGPIEPSYSLWNKIQVRSGVEIHKVLREACRDYLSKLSNVNIYLEMAKLISQSLANIWTLSLKEFPSIGPRLHVLYSGNVTLNGNKLCLTLNPPKVGVSKRYYRLLSSERFFHLKINDIENLSDEQKSSLKHLLLFPLSLAGRVYEFLYAKSDTLYYFATSGSDLPDLSIWQVINCNLPMELNKNMTVTKFYSRISLGFSNTTASIIFEPKEIRYVEDIIIDGHCFTDGCAAISLAAMKEVGEILGCQETPSAIQGRIGGAKGVWYIDPRKNFIKDKWIEIRESQMKYKHHLDHEFDHLRTLEVCHVASSPITPGTLNSQFIRVLYHGGVPVEVFLTKMKDYVDRIKSDVIGCDDPRTLISWVTDNSCIMKKRLEVSNGYFKEVFSDDDDFMFGSDVYSMSGFPDSPSEQCIQMLQAGFTPSTCPFLAKKLKSVLTSKLKSLSTKYRIDIPLSRVLMCIADPTKTLNPGEVFIQLDSDAGRDKSTGLPFGIIEDEVILARNPSCLPSDLVRVKAVKNMHLCNYFNVVIFPVNVASKGDFSLASYISGGDYDGDKIFCCWDPQIVKHYKNSPLLPLDPRVKSAFDESNQTIDELTSTKSSQIEFKLQGIILDNYLKDLEMPRGLYDYWHRLQSSEYGISNEHSIYLAQMCAQLLDATKQGLTLKQSVQQRDSEMFKKIHIPHWMGSKNRSQAKRQESNGNNFGVRDVMDVLCVSIENEMSLVNNKGFTVIEIKSEPDAHIYNFWYNELIRARQMEDDLYLEDLNSISMYALQVVQHYNRKYARTFEDRDRKESEQPSTSKNQLNINPNASNLSEEFRSIDHECLTKFLNTPPVEKYKSDIFKFLKSRRSDVVESEVDPLSIFELQLKAASLYLSSVNKKPDGQVSWVIAFRVLCNIKSQMLENEKHLFVGGPRSIIDGVWQALRIDKKWLKYKDNESN